MRIIYFEFLYALEEKEMHREPSQAKGKLGRATDTNKFP